MHVHHELASGGNLFSKVQHVVTNLQFTKGISALPVQSANGGFGLTSTCKLQKASRRRLDIEFLPRSSTPASGRLNKSRDWGGGAGVSPRAGLVLRDQIRNGFHNGGHGPPKAQVYPGRSIPQIWVYRAPAYRGLRDTLVPAYSGPKYRVPGPGFYRCTPNTYVQHGCGRT